MFKGKNKYKNTRLAKTNLFTPCQKYIVVMIYFVSEGMQKMDKRKFSEREKKQFREYAEKNSPKSNLFKDCVCAFVIGGLICIVGQAISDAGKAMDISKENVKILTPCALIFLSCLFTGLGLYSKLAKYAGAGTIVPITGFANAVASPAIDSKAEGYVLGVGAKMFTIAGPVILYGTAASVVWGIIYYILEKL